MSADCITRACMEEAVGIELTKLFRATLVFGTSALPLGYASKNHHGESLAHCTLHSSLNSRWLPARALIVVQKWRKKQELNLHSFLGPAP